MPPEDANIQDLDPSTGSEAIDEGKVADQAAQPDSGESSPPQGEPEATTLSVVRDVVAAADAKKSEVAASPAEGEAEPAAADDTPKTDQDGEEDFSDVPFNKHPRWKQVVGRMKSAELDAGRYRNVQGFLDNNGLGSEEAANALIVAGLAKTNPAEAWKQLEPWVKKVAEAAGVILPEDLRTRVQQGQLDPETAAELSRSRAQAQSFEVQRAHEQRIAEQNRTQAQVAQVYNAAEAWENDRLTKDPNFNQKRPVFTEKLKAIFFDEGRANTPQGVKDQCERAYKATNAAFRPPAPPVTSPRPLTPVRGGQVSGTVQPVVSSIHDIVRMKAHRTA
jgi:hypothetical protein